MTVHDGGVIDKQHVLGDGVTVGHFNIVILSEGYTRIEIDNQTFRSHVDAFIAALKGTDPFGSLMDKINVDVVDVWSTVSLSSTSTDDSQIPGPSATYFDAAYNHADVERELWVDTNTVAQVLKGVGIDYHHSSLVFVNSPRYGGIWDGVSTSTAAVLHINGMDIAIHELGHALGLADEYSFLKGCGADTDNEHSTGTEPHAVNVTSTLNPLKWQAHVKLSPTPKRPNPDCTKCDSVCRDESPFEHGTIGVFEGANWYHCDVYRSEWDCKMGNCVDSGFCTVCRDEIEQSIRNL